MAAMYRKPIFFGKPTSMNAAVWRQSFCPNGCAAARTDVACPGNFCIKGLNLKFVDAKLSARMASGDPYARHAAETDAAERVRSYGMLIC
jgi:hypothetical protein